MVVQELTGYAFQGNRPDQDAAPLDVNQALWRIQTHQDGLVGVSQADVVGVLPELDIPAAIDMAALALLVIVVQPRIGVNLLR